MSQVPSPRESGASTLRTRIAQLGSSELGKAGGLAGAMIANNVIALGSTVVFARLLDDYGSLAALVSYFLILSVAGQAMQVATAREAVLGHLGTGARLGATLRSWTRSLLLLTVALAVVSALLRAPIASAVGVKDEWAAAVGLPAGALWLLLSILRGALQGVGDYRAVGLSLIGEQSARLVFGTVLAAVGLDVTGAYLGTPLSLIAMALYCGWHLRRHIAEQEAKEAPKTTHPREAQLRARATRPSRPREAQLRAKATSASSLPAKATSSLPSHVARAWAPIAGLIVIAVLQNIDIIAAKHLFPKDLASSYGATAVAGKVLIWVAMGAGFYLVPETTRRRSEGEPTQPVLFHALAIIGVCAVPVLLIFAAGGRLLLKAAFGADRLLAVDALFLLGCAFTLLAVTYLAVQYLLALKRTWFLIPLGLVAAAEPVLLLTVAPSRPQGFAVVLLAIQAGAAAIALGLALRERPQQEEVALVEPFDAREQEPVAPAVE